MPPAFLERQPTVHVMKTKHLFSMLCRWLNQRQSRRKAEQCSVGTYSMLRWSCSLFFSALSSLDSRELAVWSESEFIAFIGISLRFLYFHIVFVGSAWHCCCFLCGGKKPEKLSEHHESSAKALYREISTFRMMIGARLVVYLGGRTITKPDVDRAQSRYQAHNNAGRKKRENIARLAIPLSKSLELCCARTVISFLSVFSSQNKR